MSSRTSIEVHSQQKRTQLSTHFLGEAARTLTMRANTRLLSIEALRVIAILCIAIFHSFLPWFESMVDWDGFLAGTALAPNGRASLQALVLMGGINQLGAWGNHVFIMISGFFLLPRATETSVLPGYWHMQVRVTARRIAIILTTVVLYGLIALIAHHFAPEITNAELDDWYWISFGIQFVWVYLALVVLCPFIGWLWWRVRKQNQLLAALLIVVYALNFYIAFFSQGTGEPGVLDWRKLMSAVSYGMSFLVGGWIAQHVRPGSCCYGCHAFVLALIGMIVAEFIAGSLGGIASVNALSYRSTSIFAFVMAVSALLCALAQPADSAAKYPRLARVLAFASAGTLGFYVLQAFFSTGWHTAANTILIWALGFGLAPFIVIGSLFSLLFYLAIILLDACIGQVVVRRVSKLFVGHKPAE
ncbi:acyltransferase [Atopobium sp. oral taxon 810]|uniref:acyltransferase family protein n=1 Tax=Atopobium sp. oral taxon 810 TaxID=712158 RepID=UPI001E3798E7|nr:acyltransferase [Atopobium sp. oral taxon 810]